MAWELKFYPEVKQDITSAKKWYKKQQEGLQKRFAAEVKITLQKVQAEPLLYQTKYRSVRVAYLRIFPYGIHFFVNEVTETVVITGVFHQHREPEIYHVR